MLLLDFAFTSAIAIAGAGARSQDVDCTRPGSIGYLLNCSSSVLFCFLSGFLVMGNNVERDKRALKRGEERGKKLGGNGN